MVVRHSIEIFYDEFQKVSQALCKIQVFKFGHPPPPSLRPYVNPVFKEFTLARQHRDKNYSICVHVNLTIHLIADSRS